MKKGLKNPQKLSLAFPTQLFIIQILLYKPYVGTTFFLMQDFAREGHIMIHLLAQSGFLYKYCDSIFS